jgi:hypothetical protein
VCAMVWFVLTSQTADFICRCLMPVSGYLLLIVAAIPLLELILRIYMHMHTFHIYSSSDWCNRPCAAAHVLETTKSENT